METIKNKTFAEVKEILKDNVMVKEDKSVPNLYLISAKREATPNYYGIIMEKETNKVVFMSFRDQDRAEFDENKPELSNYGLEWNSCQIEEAVEGSQIKLFCYQGEWRVASSHCIDARRANWDGYNLYDLFLEAAAYEKWDMKSLTDPKYCHLLVMQHPNNSSSIMEFREPKLFHIMSRDMSQENMPEVNLDIGLKKPNIVLKFGSMEELLKDVNENTSLDNQGYIVHDLKTEKRIKILNKTYKMASDLKMNRTSNNMIYHYLQLRAQNKVADYLKFYPKDTPIFTEFEMKLEDMISEIYQQYLRKFKFKLIKMSDVFYQFRPIVYELNGTYLATRQGITRRDVSEALFKKTPEQITFMYNMYYVGVRRILKSTLDEKVSDGQTKE